MKRSIALQIADIQGCLLNAGREVGQISTLNGAGNPEASLKAIADVMAQCDDAQRALNGLADHYSKQLWKRATEEREAK